MNDSLTSSWDDNGPGSAEPALGSHLTYHIDPQGNQNDTVTQEHLRKIKSQISYSKQLEQKACQKKGTIRALYPF